MDPKTPASATPQDDNGLIMPEQPQVTAQPTSIPVNTAPATSEPAPEPVAAPEPAPTPEPTQVPEAAPVLVSETPEVPVESVVESVPMPEAVAAGEPEVTSAPELQAVPAAIPVVEEPVVVEEVTPAPANPEVPEVAVAPAIEAPAVAPEVAVPEEADSLFDPVTEPDPLEVEPQPVAPTPGAPVTDQAMNQLDDGPHPVIASTGQTVVAASKPQKSRRKTMLILVVGLILAGAAGFAAYTFFAKPNVSETEVPAAILSVDQLSPEDLTQATDKADLSAGSQTNANVLIFSGKAPTDAPAGLSLQIEIQPLGTDFTGEPTEDAIAVADDTDPLKLTVTGYAPGSYHWQARLSDGTSNGPWTPFNSAEDAGKTADFTIDRTAPAAAAFKTLNGRTVSSKTLSSTVAQPVMTGTAEAGSSVTVAFNESLTYKATVASDGAWTMTAGATVPNGKYTMTITTTDAAGNAVVTSYTLTQAVR